MRRRALKDNLFGACYLCRFAKVKCSRDRPCARCIQLKQDDLCVQKVPIPCSLPFLLSRLMRQRPASGSVAPAARAAATGLRAQRGAARRWAAPPGFAPQISRAAAPRPNSRRACDGVLRRLQRVRRRQRTRSGRDLCRGRHLASEPRVGWRQPLAAHAVIGNICAPLPGQAGTPFPGPSLHARKRLYFAQISLRASVLSASSRQGLYARQRSLTAFLCVPDR